MTLNQTSLIFFPFIELKFHLYLRLSKNIQTILKKTINKFKMCKISKKKNSVLKIFGEQKLCTIRGVVTMVSSQHVGCDAQLKGSEGQPKVLRSSERSRSEGQPEGSEGQPQRSESQPSVGLSTSASE